MLKKGRIKKDQYYLDIAHKVYQRSTCLRRKFGAVIVKNDEIIATGYNGAPRGVKSCLEKGYCWREQNKIPPGTGYEKCPAVHAEMNAIISAARKDMIDSTMYLAGEGIDSVLYSALPCIFCRRLIINAGIVKIVYRLQTAKLKTLYPQTAKRHEDFIINKE